MTEQSNKPKAKRSRRPSTGPLIFGGSTAVVGVGSYALLSTAMANWVVIGFGIRVFSALQKICIAVIVIGILIAILGSIPIMRLITQKRREQELARVASQQQSRIRSDYAKDSANPELTRKRLRQLQQEMPSVSWLVEQCLEQMDCMDTLQAKQDVLIETNDAQYLRKTVEVLDKVERRICRNFRNVINICIATDGLDETDNQKIKRYMADNDTKLQNAQELLDASVDWINQYNADSSSDSSEVENWIAVIRESLKED